MRKLGLTLNWPLLCLLFMFQSCAQCTRQHDPSGDRRLFEQESKWANRPAEKLTAKGDIPAPGAAAAGTVDIGEKYSAYCSSCHGVTGKADGAAGQALNPKPRNFTEVAWQDQTSDERIVGVIKNGGASVGLSAAMAPWGAMLSDDEIKLMVQHIRGFKGK